MKTEKFIAYDGAETGYTVWNETENPRGVVQILHGMAEHIARYAPFAEFLNTNGFVVAGSDHRGHGVSCAKNYGKCGGDAAADSLADAMQLSGILREKYNLPLIIFGHSFGSFLTQDYILRNPDGASAFILCGSAFMGGLLSKFGRFVAGRKVKKGKADEPGDFFAKLSFQGYDKKLGEGRNAWLSRDEGEVAKYNDDESCGFVCSNGFYKSMFDLFARITDTKRLAAIDKDIKIFIISGACDPVGGNGKLVTKLVKAYQKAGVSALSFKLYDNCRHEILNETNRDDVFADILQYISGIESA